ncbi:hypothetical protein SIO70_17530 [Chitinophaga sancti]|uniref:hypothetical protein n=1 Tax=Chitinophaga sancti TaxID=1004 RepID=UPI002A75B634|nr:hypothetical protein [Chitinophaga sancti]WPQ60145.1 hypothetical protein SIO70_17530 [Chitinophaga sancti]
MASNYETLTIPVDYKKSFQDLDVQEIKDYYNWFLHIKHDRLMKLGTYLFNRDYDFLSENNLKVVENFLFNSVGTVPMPKDEYDRAYGGMSDRLKKIANVPDFILDRRTISICYDIGIYMGELMIALDSSIMWGLDKNIRSADYGQPIIKKKKFEINPFVVVKNAANKIHKKTYTEHQLISFFNAWKRGCGID